MMGRNMDYIKLSKTVSYILRHVPYEYGLQLDKDGWVNLSSLCKTLESMGEGMITENDLRKMIENTDKKRHEIADGKIRAIYGHSVEARVAYAVAIPPDILYHGTARRYYEGRLNTKRKTICSSFTRC